MRFASVIPTLHWIIGRGENAEEARLALESEWQMGFEIQDILSPEDATKRLFGQRVANLIPGQKNPRGLQDQVFVIALDDSGEDSAAQIQQLTLAGVRSIYMIPALRGIPLYGADLSYFFSHEVLFLGVKNNLTQSFSKLLKLGSDLLLTGILLVIGLPLIMLASLLIWLEDGSPVFYRQKRLGQHGREFWMIKLRSMRRDAEQQLALWEKRQSAEWQEYCQNSFKLKKDPRLLRIGALLRRSSLDELPQLFNVLCGQMSLVGPRPLLEREREAYGKNFALYALVRPGMTGLWQVSGRSEKSFIERTSLDAWYIRNWSLSYDVLILLKTVSVVMTGRGAH